MHRVESASVSMDLNTINEVAHPSSAGSIARLDGRRCLARGRDLAVLGTAGSSRPADRSHRSEMAGADRQRDRAVDRRDLHGRSARRTHLPAGLDRAHPDQPMLPRVPRLLQDLEDRDRRRQYLHVAAGGTDDLADVGARRRLHHLAGRRRRAEDRRRRFRHRQPDATCWRPAICCGRSISRSRR